MLKLPLAPMVAAWKPSAPTSTLMVSPAVAIPLERLLTVPLRLTLDALPYRKGGEGVKPEKYGEFGSEPFGATIRFKAPPLTASVAVAVPMIPLPATPASVGAVPTDMVPLACWIRV